MEVQSFEGALVWVHVWAAVGDSPKADVHNASQNKQGPECMSRHCC